MSASVIFCDDIRFETSGKLIFVGVYPEDLVPSVLPQMLQISIWARLKGVPAGTHKLRFLVGSNGKSQVEAELGVVVPEGKDLSQLTLAGLPIQLTESGHIFLTLTGFPGGEIVHAELPVLPPKTAVTETAPAE